LGLCCVYLQVLGETVDEATLTQVLLAVLDQPEDPKAETAQTQGVALSEVEAAAHHIVKRFGKIARRVAEQALQEVRGGGVEAANVGGCQWGSRLQ